MDIQQLLANIPVFLKTMIQLLIQPKKTMEEAKQYKWQYLDMLVYLKLAALPAFVGLLIGHVWFWYAQLGGAILLSLILFVASFLGVLIGGLLLNALAPMVKVTQQPMQIMKLFSFMATPFLLIGIINIYPVWPMMILTIIAAVYGFFIFYQGIPILLKIPKEQQMSFFILGIVVFVIGWAILWGVWIGLDITLESMLWPYAYGFM